MLHRILLLNALSCIGFGALFIVGPAWVAEFLSPQNPAPVLGICILGILLAVNGAHLLWASKQETPNKWLVRYFALGDFAWVIGSLLLILMSLWVTTTPGIVATLVIAAMVGGFGAMQWREVTG